VLACTRKSPPPSPASVSRSRHPGLRTARKNTVSAAGTSTSRSIVPGCPSSAYDPPCPGARAADATVATSMANPSLVDGGEGDRRDRARLVQHHLRRIDAGELRDEREEPVPERERVAGVQPAVRELVDRPDVQRAERVQLPDAAEVEERVAVHDARDVPEHGAEHEPCQRRRDARPGAAARRRLQRERKRGERDTPEHGQRDPDRRVHQEDDE